MSLTNREHVPGGVRDYGHPLGSVHLRTKATRLPRPPIACLILARRARLP